MTSEHAVPFLPARLIRLLNWWGPRLAPLGVGRRTLAVESMLREAERKTGLREWGDDAFLTPLRLLTEPDTELVRLTFFGQLMIRHTLVDGLMNRLRLEAAVNREPAILDQQVTAPLFIVGLPRTGTTLLHNLLAQDPARRAPLCWETMFPAPPPTPATHATDPRIARTEKIIRQIRHLAPAFADIHPIAARRPEECLYLLRNTFLEPVVFSVVGRFPRYLAWQATQDMIPAYRYYRRQLQVLQYRFPPAGWVLKAPVHLRYLDALLAVFPDARLIQTHRAPERVVPSYLSLFFTALRLGNHFEPPAVPILADWVLGELAGMLANAARARPRLPAARLADVQYAELVADPLGTVTRLYAHFGWDLTADCRERMRAWLAADAAQPRRPHRYTAEQFGLTPDLIAARFADYRRAFAIPAEPPAG